MIPSAGSGKRPDAIILATVRREELVVFDKEEGCEGSEEFEENDEFGSAWPGRRIVMIRKVFVRMRGEWNADEGRQKTNDEPLPLKCRCTSTTKSQISEQPSMSWKESA